MEETLSKFHKSTDRIYLSPMRLDDMVPNEEDFNDETDIYDLLRNSSAVSIRFDTHKKEWWVADTKLCYDNRRCISKCVTKEAMRKLNAIPHDSQFVGFNDKAYTYLATQMFLPYCLPRCTSEHLIVMTLKRASSIL